MPRKAHKVATNVDLNSGRLTCKVVALDDAPEITYSFLDHPEVTPDLWNSIPEIVRKHATFGLRVRVNNKTSSIDSAEASILPQTISDMFEAINSNIWHERKATSTPSATVFARALHRYMTTKLGRSDTLSDVQTQLSQMSEAQVKEIRAHRDIKNLIKVIKLEDATRAVDEMEEGDQPALALSF